MLQKTVVFFLQAFVELRISQGDLREAISKLIFCSFEADEDVEFGQSRVMVDTIEGCFKMSDENHYSISIKFCDFLFQMRIVDKCILRL